MISVSSHLYKLFQSYRCSQQPGLSLTEILYIGAYRGVPQCLDVLQQPGLSLTETYKGL